MKVLLLYPRFPQSFWSYDRALSIAGLKATIPPLGIITVAALLPADWEMRFYDRNVGQETEADWAWCDLVILSAMLAQQSDFQALIRKAVRLGKKVAVGGPYPTSVPQDALAAGADYLILDEGEMTVPQFLEAINQGHPSGIFRSIDKPDVTRCFQQCLNIKVPTGVRQTMKMPLGKGLRIFAQLIWHQGLRHPAIQAQFWQQLWTILSKKPQVLNMYLELCLAGEHFWDYRRLARERIAQQLGYDPLTDSLHAASSLTNQPVSDRRHLSTG